MVLTLTRDEVRAALLRAFEDKYPSSIERLRLRTTDIFVETHPHKVPEEDDVLAKAFIK
jgi:hypothetical protein